MVELLIYRSVTVGIPDHLESEEEMGIEMRNIGNFNLVGISYISLFHLHVLIII